MVCVCVCEWGSSPASTPDGSNERSDARLTSGWCCWSGSFEIGLQINQQVQINKCSGFSRRFRWWFIEICVIKYIALLCPWHCSLQLAVLFSVAHRGVAKQAPKAWSPGVGSEDPPPKNLVNVPATRLPGTWAGRSELFYWKSWVWRNHEKEPTQYSPRSIPRG